jgi:hypothetical protein
MRLAITSDSNQVDRVLHTPHSARTDGVAQLVCYFVDRQALSTELQHFRHEREVFEFAVLIQRRQDFLRAPDFNQISYSQSSRQGTLLGNYAFTLSIPLKIQLRGPTRMSLERIGSRAFVSRPSFG